MLSNGEKVNVKRKNARRKDKETFRELEKRLKEGAYSGVDLELNVLQLLFGRRRLLVSTTWRLVSDGEIVVTSEDLAERPFEWDGGIGGEPVTLAGYRAGLLSKIDSLLNGRTVKKVAVNGPFHDLDIDFGDDVLLQTFADSGKYEHWNLWGEQELIVGGPGQLYSRWDPPRDE